MRDEIEKRAASPAKFAAPACTRIARAADYTSRQYSAEKIWQARRTTGRHSSEPERVVKAFRDGARGVFYRNHSLKSLSKCIETVHKGQIWVCNEDIEHLIKALASSRPLEFRTADGMPLLTRREEDVVRLAADGLKNREIAEKLKVKEQELHLPNLRKVGGVQPSRTDPVRV